MCSPRRKFELKTLFRIEPDNIHWQSEGPLKWQFLQINNQSFLFINGHSWNKLWYNDFSRWSITGERQSLSVVMLLRNFPCAVCVWMSFCLYAFLLWDNTSSLLNKSWIEISTCDVNWHNLNSPLFIRVPSFTTRGVEEDEADEAKDFGTDVDMGAEDAPVRGEDSLLMIGESKNNYCHSLPNICPKDILYCTEQHNNCTLLTV